MVAAAVIGSAVVGAAASKSASKKAASAQNNATAAAAEASAEQLALERERFDFEKQQWQQGQADRDYASQMARQVGDRQIQSMDQQYNISQDYWNYQKGVFRPLEQSLVDQSMDWASDARKESEAGRAVADVSRQFDLSRQQQNRGMTRMGVNPNSGKFASMSNQIGVAEAAAKAGAANTARTNTETRGIAMQFDAAGLGRNLPSNQNAAVTAALNQGNSGVVNSQVPISIARQATADMSGAYSGMASGLGTNMNNTLALGRISAQNFYDSQNFGMNVGNNVANSLMTGYGLASGKYKPPGWTT